MPADSERATTRAGRWLLALVIPGAALAMGSLHTVTLVIVSMFACASCVLLWLEPPRRTARAARGVLIAFAILLGATTLQAIPLPAGLAGAIAPSNADIWARSLTALREPGPTWHPITVAPPATHVEILRWALYACVFLAVLRVVLVDRGAAFIERVLIASAVLVSIASLAHAAVHARSVFGVYTPHDTLGLEEGRYGPLLNQNHLAAYMNIGAALAIHGSIRSARQGIRAMALNLAAACLLAGTSVWAASRGGTASLVLTLVLVVALTGYIRGYRRVASAAGIVVALAAGGFFVGLATSESARADLSNTDLSKFALARSALRLVPESPFFGMGRGSFETVFPTVQETTTYYSFRAAENVVAQWTVEWGVPVAVAAFLSLAIALRPKVVLEAARPPIGAWVAVVVTFVHELVDFHLETPAVVIMIAACAAVVVGGRSASRERSVPRAASQRTLALASPAILLASVIFVIPTIGHSLIEERDRIAPIALDKSVSREAFRAEIRAMMLEYPAEPYFALAGAVHAQAAGSESVIPWVGRALERYPRFGRAHLVLARNLARRHRAQSRLEYRLAYEFDYRLQTSVTTEAKVLVDDFDSAMEVVPAGATGVEVLESFAAALFDTLPATSARLDAELLRRNAFATGPRRRSIAAVTADLTHEHPWCTDRAVCAAPAIDAARRLIAADRENKCEPHVQLAKLRIGAGQTNEALDELQRAAQSTSDRVVCLRALVELSFAVADKRRADAVLDLTIRSGCGAREECIDLYAWAAATAAAHGNRVRALALYKRAADVDAQGDQYIIRSAEMAESLGLTAEATEAYQRLVARHPDDARWRAKSDELRAKSIAGAHRLPP